MKKNHLLAIAIGALASLLVCFFAFSTIFFDSLENAFGNFLFYIRDQEVTDTYHVSKFTTRQVPNPKAAEYPDLPKTIEERKALVVKVDEYTLDMFGEWPFPRDVHAQFLRAARKGNPSGVFFDFLFEVPSAPPEAVLVAAKGDQGMANYLNRIYRQMDQTLANEMKRSGNVYIDLRLSELESENLTSEETGRRKAMWNALDSLMIPLDAYNLQVLKATGQHPFESFGTLLPAYVDAAKAFGAINIYPSQDGVIRSAPLIYAMSNNMFIAGNSLLLLLDYYGINPGEVNDRVSVRLGEYIAIDVPGGETKYIPIDVTGSIAVNYSGRGEVFYTRAQRMTTIDSEGNREIEERVVRDIVHGVESVSYRDIVMEDPRAMAKLDGKYLFVGAYSLGMSRDVYETPYGSMYGIAVLANAFNTMYTEQYIKTSPAVLNFLMIFLVGLLLSCALAFADLRVSSIVTVAAFIAISATSLVLFVTKNYMLLTAPALVNVALVFISIMVFKTLTEQRDKQMIKNIFSNYVNKSVVDELLQNPKAVKLGGEKKDITVFFSDVRGFTTISEALGDPQKLVELLNEYLGSMTELIFVDSGTLDKYVGDEIMAFWGAPVPNPNHALDACRSACRQMKYLWHALQPKLLLEGKPMIEIGCGLNTGEMTVGNMGSKNRMDYTLMGDNVNLGARLEGTNKQYGTGIIISEYTYERVKDRVVVRPLDLIAVKGKSKAVAIYELICLKGEEETTFYFKSDEQLAWEREAIAARNKGMTIPPLPEALRAYIEEEGKKIELAGSGEGKGKKRKPVSVKR